jgi:hypothetical protein
MKRLINFGPYAEELAKTTTIEEARPIFYDLIKSVQKEFDEIYKHALDKADVKPSALNQ